MSEEIDSSGQERRQLIRLQKELEAAGLTPRHPSTITWRLRGLIALAAGLGLGGTLGLIAVFVVWIVGRVL